MTDNEHEGMKKCTKCGERKPATSEYFHRDKTMTCGLCSMCKECKREYREKNKDRIREYYQKNKGRLREYKREHRQKNKDKIAECAHEYYQKNKDKLAEYKREYCEKNKDKIAEYKREYQEKNKDKIAERNREYYQKNKRQIIDRGREYWQTPVGKLADSIDRLRRKTGATIYVRDMTEEQKETLANQYVAVITLEKTEKELLAASGKKRCTKCDRVLDYGCFYRHGSTKDGLGVWCKECQKIPKQKKQKALDKVESIPNNRV